MKMSRRAKRMQRNHKRNSGGSAINLTALMDIFTVLLFFLIFNQNDVDIQTNDAIQLPASVSENKPENNLLVMISKDEILVQGRLITTTQAALASEGEEIGALKQELQYQAQRTSANADGSRSITIMGDKDIGYTLLKKVMKTCAAAEFGNISLAVNQAQATGGA